MLPLNVAFLGGGHVPGLREPVGLSLGFPCEPEWGLFS